MKETKKVVESFVIVHNIAKRHNVGTLARSATAFGVSELILVGRRDFNSFGNHGSVSHLHLRHFHSLNDARNFLKDRDCDICGVEIANNAVAVNQHPFSKSTAFLLGNENACQDANVAIFMKLTSIVLHQFGVWAGFTETTRDGNKFVVAERPRRQSKSSFCTESNDAIVEERRLKRESAANNNFFEHDDGACTILLDTIFERDNNIKSDDRPTCTLAVTK